MKKPDKRFCLIVGGLYLLPHVFYAVAFPLLHPHEAEGVLFSAFFRPYFWAHVFSPTRLFFSMSPLVLPVFFAITMLAGGLFSGYRWDRITTVVILVLLYLVIGYNTLFFVIFSFGNGFISA